jgi:hypothetical protein
MNLSSKDLIESLDRELHFYRSRLNWLYTYSLLAQIAVITGQQNIPLPGLAIKIVYPFVFALIGIVAIKLRFSYCERTNHIRDKRALILKDNGYQDYLPPHQYFKTTSPSKLYIVAVLTLSILGIVITLFSE